MHFPQMAARAAHFTNSTMPSPSPTPGPGGSGGSDGLPGQVGDFKLLGCLSSNSNFPSFDQTGSTSDMSLDFCAASCPSKYMGVYSSDCYCGDDLDSQTSNKVANDQCDIPCPGNEEQFCGGLMTSSRRRQVASGVLLTVYVRDEGGNDPSENANLPDADATGTDGGSGSASGGSTVTSTLTSTHTGTVTSCAPDVTDCPVGQPTSSVAVITTTFCPAPPKPTQDWHKKKIVCYGDYCAPEVPCQECQRHRVVCEDDSCRAEKCDNDDWDKLVVCKGGDCQFGQCQGGDCDNHKVVCWDGKCSKEQCYGDECHKKFVCQGDQCRHEQCSGDDCHKKEVCSGEECNTVPPCSGAQCPKPSPPAPIAVPSSNPEPQPNPAPEPNPAPQPNPSPAPPQPTPAPQPPQSPQPSNAIQPSQPIDVPVGGSNKALPAVGFTLGAVAAFAMLM